MIHEDLIVKVLGDRLVKSPLRPSLDTAINRSDLLKKRTEYYIMHRWRILIIAGKAVKPLYPLKKPGHTSTSTLKLL